MVYVHHHLGLGDHIVCNAIVRKLYRRYGDLLLAVKKHNYLSVKQLYRDLPIKFHQVYTDQDCLQMYSRYTAIRIGFENCRSDWEKSFYDQMGIEYSERYSGFYIDRDFNREKILEDQLNLPDKFAFCSVASSKGRYYIDINTDLFKVYLEPKTESLFDWIGIIEKAEEIHIVDTSIFQLIKQLDLNIKKVFYDMKKGVFTLPFEDQTWQVK